MSKEKPEVGELWEHKSSQRKAIVTYNSMMRSENIMAYVLFDGIRSYALEEYVLKENYTYLGKSKANVSDLFEVAE